MKLTHVGISNFRSIGEERVIIDLTKKITVLVGANNCGKSNVLRALCSFGVKTENELDMHQRTKSAYPTFWVSAISDDGDMHELRNMGPITIGWRQTNDGEATLGKPFKKLEWPAFEPIWNGLTTPGYHFGGWPSENEIENEKAKTSLHLFFALKSQLPKATLIPQFRQILPSEDYSVEGKGIIGVLARWQHPQIGEDSNRNRFLKVQELLRTLIQSPDVSLEVDHAAQHIVVENGALRLPLESYGTGIHELIILSIAVLGHDNSLVCIEEPEIHLHPLLQRRFLDFLRRETSNRYVITTHSPALITPSAETAVTHLWLENGITKSRPVETTGHSLEALRDLGAKASDLLQANSVIWVEGPSDRIYLNRWLELLYPGELREGIDYSIMFYGGRLLAHVSLGRTEDVSDIEEADDLVHLLRINQHSAVLIDSDRREKSAPLNSTKLRVQQECTASKVLCWITDGREIENYVPSEALVATYSELSGSKPDIRFRSFDNIESALKRSLQKSWPRANYYDQSKPQMARRIAPHITKEMIGPDLAAWLNTLVRVIRHETI